MYNRIVRIIIAALFYFDIKSQARSCATTFSYDVSRKQRQYVIHRSGVNKTIYCDVGRTLEILSLFFFNDENVMMQ